MFWKGQPQRRILNSVDSRGKSLREGPVRSSENEREHSEHDERAQVQQWKSREICVSKNVDETVRLQSEKKRRVNTREAAMDCRE